jgi:hypothetical protein
MRLRKVMSDFSDKVLKKIEQEQVTPLPKSYFRLKKLLIWSAIAIITAASAIGLSMLVVKFDGMALEGLKYGGIDASAILALLATPALWTLIFAIFLMGATAFLQKSPRGYRYRASTWGAFAIAATLIGGSLFYRSGAATATDLLLQKHSSGYRFLCERGLYFWQQPDKGMILATLTGEPVMEIYMDAIDASGKRWHVDLSDTVWRGRLSARDGVRVRILGVRTGEDRIKAKEIRPWPGTGPNRYRRMHHFSP